MQVYVRSFSEPGRPIQVSRDGVHGFGWWSRDGRQIVFADLQSARAAVVSKGVAPIFLAQWNSKWHSTQAPSESATEDSR
jgi:hypothetical protein